MKLTGCALFVYALALEGDAAARQRVLAIWKSCPRLGMTVAVPGVDVGPTRRDDAGDYRLFGAHIDPAREAAGAMYQAVLYEYQDVLGVVVCLAPNRPADQVETWQALLDEWRDAADPAPPPEGLRGEVYVFAALGEGLAMQANDFRVPPDVVEGVPAEPGSAPPSAAAYRTDVLSGFHLWERGRVAGRPTVGLLAPDSEEERLTAWMLLPSVAHRVPPLAQHLLHACKFRFELDLYRREMPQVRKLREETDSALEDLLAIHERMTRARHRLSLDDLTRARARLSWTQARSGGLLFSGSRLKELARTVRIAVRNLESLTGPEPSAGPDAEALDVSLFGRDVARARRLIEQVEHDVGYIEVVRERAQEAHVMTQALIEDVAGRHEQTARRLQLLQTIIVGVVGLGFTAMQALASPLKPIHVPVIAVVLAFALAAPLLTAHASHEHGWLDYLSAGLLGASTAWLGTALLAEWTGQTVAPAVTVALAGGGFLVAIAVVYGMSRRDGRGPRPG